MKRVGFGMSGTVVCAPVVINLVGIIAPLNRRDECVAYELDTLQQLDARLSARVLNRAEQSGPGKLPPMSVRK